MFQGVVGRVDTLRDFDASIYYASGLAGRGDAKELLSVWPRWFDGECCSSRGKNLDEVRVVSWVLSLFVELTEPILRKFWLIGARNSYITSTGSFQIVHVR